MLNGFVDGELDAAHSLQLEQHLKSCSPCVTRLEKLQQLRKVVGQDGVRWRAPDHVRAQVLASISRHAVPRSAVSRPFRNARWSDVFQFVRQWSFVPSLAALAAALIIVLAPVRDRSPVLDEILSSHIRSLLVDHLTDVASSDQHTVKPWFNGKIDFSPPVVDLVSQGFPLMGGRLDYIDGRVVPVLVYKRNGHLINVFIWPGQPSAMAMLSRDGYNIESWSRDGLTFWAVSDVSGADLSRFADAFSSLAAR
jgi:anti-sigma factor RsiW